MKFVVILTLFVACLSVTNASGSYFKILATKAKDYVTKQTGPQTLALTTRMRAPQTKTALMLAKSAVGEQSWSSLCNYAILMLLYLENFAYYYNLDTLPLQCFTQEIYNHLAMVCEMVENPRAEKADVDEDYCNNLNDWLDYLKKSSEEMQD